MIIKCGIIGLPNIGKSTIFNFLTNSKVKTENYPFCTINPNIGYSYYKDKRLFILNKLTKSKKITFAYIKFIDIAGLIKDAYKGDGLGNNFLTNIQSTNILIHVIRFFKDKKIINIYNNLNPIKNIKIINNELIYNDINICNDLIKKKIFLNKNKLFILKILKILKKNILLNKIKFNYNELKFLKTNNFLTIKPMIYIGNINNINYKKNSFLNFCKKNNIYIFFINPYKYYNNIEKKVTLINKIIYKILYFLKLKTFFTFNYNELKAWLVYKNTNLINGSSRIHTDFYKLFIKAKIIKYKDYIYYKNMKLLKKYGKIYIKGKNYLIKDGDIINFILNKKL